MLSVTTNLCGWFVTLKASCWIVGGPSAGTFVDRLVGLALTILPFRSGGNLVDNMVGRYVEEIIKRGDFIDTAAFS